MRIAHATDIHWFAPPRLTELSFKRMLGTANLYLRGRRHRFSREVQQALVAHLVDLEPDLILLTGDLTCQALDAEFELAVSDLRPALERFPTLVLPGNHDVYTPEAQRSGAMQRWFGEWMQLADSGVARLELGNVTVLGLNPNRPLLVGASGQLPDEQLAALADALTDPELASRQLVLALHYPPIDRRGTTYDNAAHGLLNAQDLIAVLDAAPVRPTLIACGHVHHGFRQPLVLSDGAQVPVCNCGSSGQAYLPDRGWHAAMAVYEVSEEGLSAERFVHNGERFVPEPGGAWG